jgi:autoinducer 2-degrading protein
MEKELIVKWKIKASETARVLQLLPGLVESTRMEPGNIFYHIYQSANDQNELILHERYANEDALEAHKGSEHYQTTVLVHIIHHLETREVLVVSKLF